MAEAELTPSAAQVDLERRRGQEVGDSAVGAVESNPASFGVEEYVGTDPVYQNYAEDVHKPLAADDGVWKDQEEEFRERSLSHLEDPPEAKEEPDTEDPVEANQRQHEARLKAYEAKQKQVESDAAGPFAYNATAGGEYDLTDEGVDVGSSEALSESEASDASTGDATDQTAF